jgi:hypothetical protein
MKRSPQEKFSLLFEAAKRSLLIANTLHERVLTSLSTLEDDITREVDVGARAAPPFMDAISLIDFCHRFGALFDALPLINKKELVPRKLQSHLASVEVARNYLQHIRGDLTTNAGITYPILGALLWSKGRRTFTLQFSQSYETEAVTMPFDMQERRWTSGLQYRAKETYVDLSAAVAAMNTAYQWLTSQIQTDDRSVVDLAWGKTVAISAVVTFSDE